MKREHKEALRDLGFTLQSINYAYPDPALLRDIGVQNYDDVVDVKIMGQFRNVQALVDLQENLLILQAVKKANNPACKDLLAKMKTLAGITKNNG